MPEYLSLPPMEHLVASDVDSISSDSAPSSVISGTSTPLTTSNLSSSSLEVERLPSLLDGSGSAPGPTSLTADNQSYILVTGGLGYIGSHTSLELLREGYNGKVSHDRLQSLNQRDSHQGYAAYLLTSSF